MALTFLSATLGTLTALSVSVPCAPGLQDSVVAQLSKPGREAFRTLLVTEWFTSEASGITGIASRENLALRTLWREPLADRALKELEGRATTAGRLFALCGLYYTDREAFRERVEPYRKSRETVNFRRGCIGRMGYPVVDLVEQGGPAVVRLNSNQTVEAWRAAHRRFQYRAVLDILGGGWPEVFRAREPSWDLKA